jgi:hypothetical protein
MKPFESTPQVREYLWRELAQDSSNVTVCLARFHFHTVEACVAIKKHQKMDELEFFLLRAANRLTQPTTEGLNNLLHIGNQVIRQIVLVLVGNQLLQENTDGSYQITKHGFDALRSKEMIIHQHKRCHFHFVSGSNEFLRIKDLRGMYLRDLAPKETGSGWIFNVETLRRCISESDQWKRERGFPVDVVSLITGQDIDSQQTAKYANNKIEENSLSANNNPAQKRDTLIVDKAQGIDCAVVIRFQEDRPTELKAYPFLSKGFLHSGDQNVLFSLNSTDSILKVFPDIDALPTRQQLDVAWQALGQDYGIENTSRISVKTDKTSMAVAVDRKLISEWLEFCWQVTKGGIFSCIELENMTRLYNVSLEATSKAAEEQLQTLKLLHQLKNADQLENILCNISIYRQWLAAGEFSIDPDISELSSLAWTLEEFRLAYRLAELKDMSDAEL